MILRLFLLWSFIGFSAEVDYVVGRTPPMGWSSINLQCNLTEKFIQKIADAMVYNGLSSVGYVYVNLDDCWQGDRDAQGNIQGNASAFPNGIAALADYVHSRKLRFGLYSDANHKTCAGRPGSFGYETKDANTYASWNVDYLKYDNCNPDRSIPEKRYPVMQQALDAAGRPIFFALFGTASLPQPIRGQIGNSRRTTGDIEDNWKIMLNIIDINNEYANLSGPSNWNDPDLLQIGNGHMTTAEYISHFSLWAISKAPLIIGLNVTKISQTSLLILTNPEVIAVNQDPLGVQGRKVAFSSSQLPNASTEVILANCLSSSSMIEPRRRQWMYNSQGGTIRSRLNGRCLTLDNHSRKKSTKIVLRECQKLSASSNQQWIIDRSSHTIISQSSEKCLDVSTYPCHNQTWMWNPVDGTVRTRTNDQCLTVQQELEIWAGPLAGGSQAVLLLNRGDIGSESITVKWTDIGFPADRNATVRDLWARRPVGIFQGSFTSPNIDAHSIMMLTITPTT